MAGIVLRSILPKKPILDIRKLEREWTAVLNDTANGIQKDFVATYPKPAYKLTRATPSSRKLRSAVDSNDEILNYNVLGTRPHMIVARRASMLRFQTGYTRKVKPGKIGRSGGGVFGPTVFAKAVRHPGTTGTHVDETIAKKWQPELVRGAAKAIKESTS